MCVIYLLCQINRAIFNSLSHDIVADLHKDTLKLTQSLSPYRDTQKRYTHAVLQHFSLVTLKFAVFCAVAILF